MDNEKEFFFFLRANYRNISNKMLKWNRDGHYHSNYLLLCRNRQWKQPVQSRKRITWNVWRQIDDVNFQENKNDKHRQHPGPCSAKSDSFCYLSSIMTTIGAAETDGNNWPSKARATFGGLQKLTNMQNDSKWKYLKHL